MGCCWRWSRADAFLFRHQIDQASYERQRDRIRQQITLGEFELTEATVEQLDLEGLLGFAEHVLGNARALWVQATAEQRVRLQAVLFPEGVPFDGARFGTAATCLAFAQLPEPGGQRDGVASPTGFEAEAPPEPSSQPVDQTIGDNGLCRESNNENRRD